MVTQVFKSQQDNEKKDTDLNCVIVQRYRYPKCPKFNWSNCRPVYKNIYEEDQSQTEFLGHESEFLNALPFLEVSGKETIKTAL